MQTIMIWRTQHHCNMPSLSSPSLTATTSPWVRIWISRWSQFFRFKAMIELAESHPILKHAHDSLTLTTYSESIETIRKCWPVVTRWWWATTIDSRIPATSSETAGKSFNHFRPDAIDSIDRIPIAFVGLHFRRNGKVAWNIEETHGQNLTRVGFVEALYNDRSLFWRYYFI